jgi:hypothetical protein
VNLDLQNNQGLTALELAIKLKMSDCCKVLVREGYADVRQTKDLKGLRILLGTEVDSTGKQHSFMWSNGVRARRLIFLGLPVQLISYERFD